MRSVPSNGKVSLIRVFLATPGGMEDARKAVIRVVWNLNRPGGVVDQRGFRFEVLDGFRDPTLNMKRPEEVLLEDLPVESWDVFVGILWHRFGTPTGAAHPRTGAPFESGTQEEFERAYEAYQLTGRPRILIYRCNRPLSSHPGEIDTQQLAQVNAFLDQFEPDGNHPGLVGTFEEVADLQLDLTHNLTRLLDLFAEKRSESVPGEDTPEVQSDPATSAPGGGCTASPTSQLPEAGSEMSLLRLDVVEHSAMIRRFGAAGSRILDSFEKLVQQTCKSWGGIAFGWEGDGGMFGFEGSGRQYRALMAALEIWQTLPCLQLNRTHNPRQIPLEIRMAAHDGLVCFVGPTGSIHSEAVNLLAHLEKNGTGRGELCITDDLYRALDPDIQRLFSLKGRFADRNIYAHPEPRRECPPPVDSLEDLLNEARGETTFLVKTLDVGTGNHLQKSEIRTLRTAIDKVYDAVRRVGDWFPSLDQRWSAVYLQEIDHCTEGLLELDEQVTAAFDRRFQRLSGEERSLDIDLEVLWRFLSGQRSWKVARLKKLHQTLGELLGATPLPSTPRSLEPTEEVRRKVSWFSQSRDQLEKEELFAELLMKSSKGLLGMISGEEDRPLIDELWKRAELILVQERQSAPSLWSGGPLFQALMASRTDPGRFRTVGDFLATHDRPCQDLAASRFAANGYQAGPKELLEQVQILWRSLLVAHSSPEVRHQATRLADVHGFWLLATHPQVPLRVLREIALRLQEEGDAELQKLLFDCSRSRIAAALEAAEGNGDLERIRPLLLLFSSLDALGEEGYWERLEALQEMFIEKASRLGQKVDDLESRRAWLSERRPVAWAATRTSPGFLGTKKVPEFVQRHLAREGCYLDHCVKQKDPIALATLPHLTQQNLSRLLTPAFNPRLLMKLCREKEFCAERPLIFKVLRHRHCPVPFAEMYLAKLNVTERKVIAADHNANPAVRKILTRRTNL